MECDAVLAQFVNGVFNFVKILHFAGPILLILALGINFAKGVIDPDSYEQKGAKTYLNSLLAALLLFLLPYMINVSVDIVDPNNKFSLTSCWKQAQNADVHGPGYVETPDDANRNKIFDNDSNKKKSNSK